MKVHEYLKTVEEQIRARVYRKISERSCWDILRRIRNISGERE